MQKVEAAISVSYIKEVELSTSFVHDNRILPEREFYYLKFKHLRNKKPSMIDKVWQIYFNYNKRQNLLQDKK